MLQLRRTNWRKKSENTYLQVINTTEVLTMWQLMLFKERREKERERERTQLSEQIQSPSGAGIA